MKKLQNVTGRLEEGGKYKSAMLRYAQGPTDTSVEDEIHQLLALLVKKGEKIKSSDIFAAIVSIADAARTFMIDDEIFITEGTWHCMKRSIDAKDRKKFQVIDEEKYGCHGEDAILTREWWRDEDGS